MTTQDCPNVVPGGEVAAKLATWEAEVEAAGSERAEPYEQLLRKLRYLLHENHYLLTDCKRRLIGSSSSHPDTCVCPHVACMY